MADSQGYYSSSSEADRMIIDLGSSEGDFGNDGSANTANETDVGGSSQFSPTKRVKSPNARSEGVSVKSPNARSEGVIELLPSGVDLLDDIFRRPQRSENDQHIPTNSNCDGAANVNVDEDNPFDVQEVDNDNGSRNDDSDNDNRLVMVIEGATDGATEEEGDEKESVSLNVFSSLKQSEAVGEEADDNEICQTECALDYSEATEEEVDAEKGAISQNVTSTPKQRKIETEKGDTNEIISRKESCSQEQSDGTEEEMDVGKEEVSLNDSLNVTTSPEHNKAVEEDTAGNKESVSRRMTSSPQHSVPFYLSDTFLDNLNPQDDSQSLDDEEDEPGKARRDSVENNDGHDSERSTGILEHSSQFELSETFLDNLNPQDSSQDLQDEKDDEVIVIDTSRDEASSPCTQEVATGDEASSIPEDHCGDGDSCAEQNTSIPEDHCGDEDSSAELNTSMEEAVPSPCLKQHTSPSPLQDTSLCGEASSPPSQLDSLAHEASSPHTHQHANTEELDEASSPHTHQHANTEELSSACGQRSPSSEALSSVHHQDRTLRNVSSSPVQPNADEAICPAQLNTTSEEDGHVSQDDNHGHGLETKEKDCDQIVEDVSEDQASPTHGQKDDTSNVCAAKDTAMGGDYQSDEEKAVPEMVSSSPTQKITTTDQDSSPAEGNTTTEEPSSPLVQREIRGESDEVISFQDIKCSFSSSEDNEKAHDGNEGTSLYSVEEERQALATASEGRDEDESSAKEDDDDSVREEGEYSSSPSPPPSEPDNQDGNLSDVLQLSADDVEIRDEDTDNKKKKKERNGKGSSLWEKPVNRDPLPQSHSGHNDQSDDSGSAPLMEVNSYVEEDSSSQDKLKNDELEKGEKNTNISDEDGIDIEAGVDLDDRDDNNTADTAGPAPGVTQAIRESGEKSGDEGDPKTLQANHDESDDDVQIIEVPQDPVDTLIVDDDDDDLVPSSNVSSKPPVSESSRTSKKKRTVEQDGHDLRIVIRDERHEKEDSDRHQRRHDRERRDERRTDSHRRLEADRKSSDRSSRRRHRRSHSHSRERRRKRTRSRSHSRERSSRRRHHRERSRDKSPDRERSSHRKRRRDRSRERRHRSHSRSRSPKHSREDSWDKENRDDREAVEHRSKRRRYHRDEKKRRESHEEERTSSKQDTPPPQRRSQKHSSPWKPSDTFLKDPSDTPSTAREKSDDEESEESIEEVVQKVQKKVKQRVVSKDKTKAVPAGIPMPEPQDIPIPKPEDIPIPETENIPVPELFHIPIPQPELRPEPAPPIPMLLHPPPFFENPPLPPVPEEEPMENPPEPPPLPPRWPEVAPQKGEGLLPTPIRRKAALEEAAAAAVYDPAHPTDDDGERFMFPGVAPNAGPPPPPEMMGGPRLAGPMRSDGPFVVPAPGEGSLLGPPPPRIPPMQPPRFGLHHRPMMMNHVVMDRPPFNNGPFPPNQPPGLPPRFHMEMGGPGDVMPPQNQFGQGPPPPGPPPHHQGFPGPLGERFEDGPPGPPVGHFPVSVHPGMPEMPSMAPPPGPPPPDMHMMPCPLPPDMPMQENHGPDEEFDKTLASLVVTQNLLTVLNDRKTDREAAASVFKVPPPVMELQTKSPSNRFHLPAEGAVDVDPSEDSIEVMDMDMSPLDEDFEEQLPAGTRGAADGEQDKKPKSLVAIDLRAISNALLKLTSVATDEMPASAVELTNKEKYMKKLHLQERVVDEVKQALRPFYSHKKIDKEQYKTILRKAVPKVCHSKSGDINPQKIQQLVESYVSKFQKQRQHTDQKVKPPNTEEEPDDQDQENGERAQPAR